MERAGRKASGAEAAMMSEDSELEEAEMD